MLLIPSTYDLPRQDRKVSGKAEGERRQTRGFAAFRFPPSAFAIVNLFLKHNASARANPELAATNVRLPAICRLSRL
jgi:hypothetical protein